MSDKERKYNRYYGDIAERAAKMTHCVRAEVGCVIVNDGQIIADGWNGMPAGMDNCCEEDNVTRDEVLHAEENALMKVSRSNHSSVGATMYITHAPCIKCSRLIHRAGIEKVYFNRYYKDTRGIDFLNSVGIETIFNMNL